MPEDLRLLALDGGGVRGLSALIILKKLMETVNQDAPPKPCEYFDMIGGTSTGGLIAIMLGRLRMTIDECIDAYLNLSEKVFQKKRSRFGLTGQIRGRFDSVELERAVKEVIKKKGLRDDVLLKDSDESSCKVFVCATSKQTSGTVCLTSYSSPRGNSDLLNSARVWEACRATSAASTFFEPIAIGRYGEEFVDGATGANNPVTELWDQAKLLWGAEPLERKVKCLVSIGTGLPKLEAFSHDLRYIASTLVAIATETEKTAERFQREKAGLGTNLRYFRFNVTRGLEAIGLEESKKKKEIAAATHHYVDSEDVLTQMRSCAGTLVDRGYMNQFRTPFTLEDTARITSFVERPEEMARLEQVLLPGRKGMRQKVFVLHGLGGIGKTQLALEFAHRHRGEFSSVFWLNGSSASNLKLSIAKCAARIPANQISDPSRLYSTSLEGELDDVVEEVMAWLAQPENTRWLLVFDGVDRDYSPQVADSLSYDVRRYFSSKTHGSILVTTRLARPEQLEGSHLVRKMNRVQAQEVLQSWCSQKFNPEESDQLFELLDGLPLAIAQAGAYLQQSGISLCTYLAGYKQHWSELMKMSDELGLSPSDHLDRTLWTTWSMSFDAVQKRDRLAADLLRLWSFFDNKDLCFEVFDTAFAASRKAEAEVPKWIESLATKPLLFIRSVVLLRRYSLVESVEGRDSYTIHPVVHRWVRNTGGSDFDRELARLAAVVVGFAVPAKTAKNGSVMQRRLLPHAEACYELAVGDADCKSEVGTTSKECGTYLKAIHLLGVLYTDVGRPKEAEALYLRALRGNEAWGAKHIMTLNTVHNLGFLYASLGRTTESETAYRRALAGFEETVGPNHSLALDTVNNLGILSKNQGKLKEAEDLYLRALEGKNDVYGSEHLSTLETINNLGVLYRIQGKLQDAEKLLLRVSECNKDASGSKHALSLNAASNLGSLYATQGKAKQAEDIYLRALEGRETLWGPRHTTTLDVIYNLGNLYANSGRTEDAERMYSKALEGYNEVWGAKHKSTLDTLNGLGSLRRMQGRFTEAEGLFLRAIKGCEKLCGPEHTSTLDALNNLGNVYVDLDRWEDAEETYRRALEGFERAEGNHEDSVRYLRDRLSTIREIRENVQISKDIAPASEMECYDTESEVLKL